MVDVNDSVTGSTRPATVGRVAALVGISVRTLHHYDDIGLVVPSGRTSAGYRTYDAGDVERLYAVLSYRALGFSLDEIRGLLDDDGVDPLVHLVRQKALIADRIDHLESMATAVDRMIEEKQMNTPLSAEEQREIWGDDWVGDDYAAEAQERWGDTDAWSQSQERQKSFTKDDWIRIKQDSDRLEADMADAMAAGVSPGSDDANRLAERHRASIETYYDCDHAMHVCVAGMYTSDARFTAHYDQRAPGLAAWIVDIVNANARAHGVSVD